MKNAAAKARNEARSVGELVQASAPDTIAILTLRDKHY
jgi:hypothetical protein